MIKSLNSHAEALNNHFVKQFTEGMRDIIRAVDPRPWEDRCRECREPSPTSKFKVAGKGTYFPNLHTLDKLRHDVGIECEICGGEGMIPIPFKDLGFDD